ncbi:MAG: glycosyltransferase [Acidobacteria bacterium ACB1]|nr:glycosyltransferase [Acidobacteria bacterium ACB1]
MPAKTSVVIPKYNYGRFIGEALRSVFAQTLSPVEVIVVDDGSTDETAEAVAEFGERVRYILQENAGVCAARNRGVAESSGDLIAFLDADDIWEPTKLEKQAAKFADPEVGLVHCGMREFDSDTGETLGVKLDGGEGEVWRALLLWEGPVIIGPGGTIMVSRKAFDEAGGFDTRSRVGEDWDFCYRVARRRKVGFVKEPLVNYRVHSKAAHLNIAEMERGMSLFYEKAFADGDEQVQALKRQALSNCHRILAGSYFQAGQYRDFLRTAAKSVLKTPSNIGYFLEFPLRRFRAKKD